MVSKLKYAQKRIARGQPLPPSPKKPKPLRAEIGTCDGKGGIIRVSDL